MVATRYTISSAPVEQAYTRNIAALLQVTLDMFDWRHRPSGDVFNTKHSYFPDVSVQFPLPCLFGSNVCSVKQVFLNHFNPQVETVYGVPNKHTYVLLLLRCVVSMNNFGHQFGAS